MLTTQLGDDFQGNYAFQLGELRAGYRSDLALVAAAPPSAPGTPYVTVNAVIATNYDTVTVDFTPGFFSTAAQIVYMVNNGVTWVGPWTNAASPFEGSFNVPPGTLFKVAAQAINSAGVGPLSDYVTNWSARYAVPSTAPGRPTLLANNSVNATYSSVYVNFTAATGASSGQVIHQMYNGVTWIGPWTNGATATWGMFNVPPGTIFKVAARGVNVLGVGPMSDYYTNVSTPYNP